MGEAPGPEGFSAARRGGGGRKVSFEIRGRGEKRRVPEGRRAHLGLLLAEGSICLVSVLVGLRASERGKNERSVNERGEMGTPTRA